MLISILLISIVLGLLNIFMIYVLVLILNQLIVVRADVEILKEFQSKDIADYLYKKGFKSEAINSMNFQEYSKYLKERKKDA